MTPTLPYGKWDSQRPGRAGPSPRLRAQSSIALRALANLWDLEESLPEGKPTESDIHNAARAPTREGDVHIFPKP